MLQTDIYHKGKGMGISNACTMLTNSIFGLNHLCFLNKLLNTIEYLYLNIFVFIIYIQILLICNCNTNLPKTVTFV